jgi:hypothetical protein
VVLASSAKEDEVQHYLDLLDARDLADGWTTSAGFSEAELRDAGAVAVFESLEDLRARLDETPLGG